MDKGDKKRVIIILSAIGIILIAAIVMLYLGRLSIRSGERSPISQPDPAAFKVEMMDEQEKAEQNIGQGQEVQVLERNASGEVMTYKLINSDSDIIESLSEIK
jgi:hypothetical protein